MMALDKAWFEQRCDGYLTSNYIALYNTIASVTLAVAGLAAASLISLPPILQEYGITLRLVWLTSLLATVVAYAGTATGAVALPPELPSGFDLLTPLIIGVAEFLMFGVLAHQATGLDRPELILETWYFSTVGFGLFAATAIWRARRLILIGEYASDLKPIMVAYSRRLISDAISAYYVAFLGAIGGLSYAFGTAGPHPLRNYLLIGLLLTALIGALVSHSVTSRRFKAALLPPRNPNEALAR